MPPEPSLAGVAAAPAPGPLERLPRFARASVEATFTPLFFALAGAAIGVVAVAAP